MAGEKAILANKILTDKTGTNTSIKRVHSVDSFRLLPHVCEIEKKRA